LELKRFMDCRDFRNHHLAFTDNTLTDVELVAMQRHLAECERCARHDMAMRRGLLILRNLPAIEPSPDFASRLNARLRNLHRADARAALYRGPSVGTFLAALAAVLITGFVIASTLDLRGSGRVVTLAPIVASIPDPAPSPLIHHTVAASASGGMMVWPAAVLAEQAPIQLVNAELRLASWGGSR
jgi:hypothetical protein